MNIDRLEALLEWKKDIALLCHYLGVFMFKESPGADRNSGFFDPFP